MILRNISKIVGLYFFAYTAALMVPLLLAIYYQFIVPEEHPQPHTTVDFLLSILITLCIAGGFYLYGLPVKGRIYRREGLAAVVIIWFLTPLISALPFWVSGTLKNPLAASLQGASRT